MKGMKSSMKMIIEGSEVSFDVDMMKEISDCSFHLLIKNSQVFLLPCFPKVKDAHRAENFPMKLERFVERLRNELRQSSARIELTGQRKYNGILLLPEEPQGDDEAPENNILWLREKKIYDLRDFHKVPAELFTSRNYNVMIEDQVGIKENGDFLYSISFEKNMTKLEAVTILKETVEQHPDGWFDESDLNFYVWESDDQMNHSLMIRRLDR